jgi:hypothetical protein
MRTHPSTWVAVCLSALCLNACDKGPLGPTVPKVEAIKVEPDAAKRSPVEGTTVPPADSVVERANQTPKADATGRSNSELTRAQESSAMPVPGQNNDHSAPLKAEEGASAPKTSSPSR